MADMVAWSDIRVGEAASEDKPGETKVVKAGESVSKGDFSDDMWAQLVESGVVRTLPYPEMPETYQDSPVNFLREQARLAADTAMAEATASEENMNAIAFANAASSGTALTEQELSPEVAAEMQRQLEAEGGGSSTSSAAKPQTASTSASSEK